MTTELLCYRGSQTKDAAKTARSVESWTPCLGAAVIWAATPGNVWHGTKPKWGPDATVTEAAVDVSSALRLGEGDTFTSLHEVMLALRFGHENGITEEEVRRVYTYLHRRMVGTAPGGEFSFVLLEEDRENPREESEVEFNLRNPQTLISLARDEFDWCASDEDRLDVANLLRADTFIFADAPAVQKVAKRLGFTTLAYSDVFVGGVSAASSLLNVNLYDMDCVEERWDVKEDLVPSHDTVRPLVPSVVRLIGSTHATAAAKELLAQMQK